ncbi:hypothetical protein LAWI1_G006789 [Lachnellula willkommii]|uniref:Uncharacterized protein n=1 Tax=Lachnellula willkommii TaxID=215461 RepID=A0A559MG60_9HELO|nr:hypothetical protein LAWI1_G006789 [Lachnellula willkommii]
MGRTSKFSFPIPGRKHSSKKAPSAEPLKEPARPPTISKGSKAQRILGTENALNIDSPTQAEYAYEFPIPKRKPSRMSISISESTNESGSFHGSQSEQWDRESGVFPQGERVGQRHNDDGTASISSGQLRREESSSTLRSHYDHQKSPLSISQQTSASSARDLALRKGFPPAVQRSPLLQIDLTESFDRAEESRYQYEFSQDKAASRKKPAKLDLSMLFPKSRRRGSKSSDAESMAPSTKSVPTNGSRLSRIPADPASRKLAKLPSKDSLRSKESVRSSHSTYDPNQRNSSNNTGVTPYQLYDHYEHMPVPSSHMDRLPEVPKVPECIVPRDQAGGNYSNPKESHSRQPKDWDSAQSPAENGNFSWKKVRSIMGGNEGSSAASISSRNTKTSQHTSRSGISNADLRLNSVLSLSSDSEGESSDREAIESPVLSSRSKASKTSSQRISKISAAQRINEPQKISEPQRPARQQSGGLTPRSHSSRNGSRKVASQESQFQSIPEASSTDAPFPRRAVRQEPTKSSSHQKEPRQSSQKEKRISRKPPVTHTTSLQPTPPLSPHSIELQEGTKPSSRFMAVTKQEEALLEALRQKRARMRDEIIEEHDKGKAPPKITVKRAARHSKQPSASTMRESERQKIMLYLDTPPSDSHRISMAEPSPDLSDFLSFGSDDDSTPRGSWAPPPKAQAKSSSAKKMRNSKASPITPPSAARLSAVGTPDFLENRPAEQVGTKKQGTGVRFVEEPKVVNEQEFLFDDNEAEGVWGV